jgi:alcohol dehydrogenase YqhD (iron-dependent ADH family)
MNRFIAYNPTKLHFGEGVVGDLGMNAEALGKHALLVYGGGSVLRNGSYSDTLAQLQQKGIKVTEYNGIKPNPLVDDVREAARLGRSAGVDMVVAVGGGSVIDSAKIIALCIASECDAWDVMSGRCTPQKALPLIAVLTLAATGTEMNAVAVLQNTDTMEKIGYRNEMIYPAHSFLDPSYTTSVPPDYTAYGVVDLIAHCLEAWFGEGDASLSDKFVVSIISEAMESGPLLMKDLTNYELRAKIMWAATNALNNTTIYGRTSGDWGVHALGHVLSFLYDTAHGATLSIIYPAWFKVMKERAADRILKIGQALFEAESIDATISEFETLFNKLGSPIRCQQVSIDDSKKDEILALMNRNNAGGLHFSLTDSDRASIAEWIFS